MGGVGGDEGEKCIGVRDHGVNRENSLIDDSEVLKESVCAIRFSNGENGGVI